jgi:hypothetical protein
MMNCPTAYRAQRWPQIHSHVVRLDGQLTIRSLYIDVNGEIKGLYAGRHVCSSGGLTVRTAIRKLAPRFLAEHLK